MPSETFLAYYAARMAGAPLAIALPGFPSRLASFFICSRDFRWHKNGKVLQHADAIESHDDDATP